MGNGDNEMKQQCKDEGMEPVLSLAKSNSIWHQKDLTAKRLVGDYKKLNEVLVKPKYPIPLISDVLDQLRGSNYFTTPGFKHAGFNNYQSPKVRETSCLLQQQSGTFRPRTLP
ncbi:hypothetical protein BV898_16347 [Hypsibius exemplaris]|uniref:Uncharacterized protein n=1 Tax=Hypsibius exemplaris TaxID=2072580 RepID=A0A9X6NFS4_HYPEX|nr:hypothetical protein BV898_16347 [Hypsibius exemplaris]